ncbi:MAG: ferritin-like domain-containing protein [Pseudonocardiaceae bacterium]
MTTTAAPQDQIVRLMQVSQDQRDLEWIKTSLQAAIALELSTIPPYLCGLWSIRNPAPGEQGEQAAQLIRSIVIDEMFHMGLASNMLSAIGGTPQIIAAAPAYPGPLPGGVRPQLTVYLSGLTKEYVREVFMEIEMPEDPLALAREEGPPTIGAFYEALSEAFRQVQPAISMNRQLSRGVGTNNLAPVTDLADVEDSIDLIKEQGEGTSTSPEAPQAAGELAHYYKFGEIYYGRELRQVNGRWEFTGDVVPFPDVYPMGVVPAGGWPNPDPEVQDLLRTFNENYTSILQDLERAWAEGNEDALTSSIGTMFLLQGTADELLTIPLPSGDGSYGPEFRVTT